MIIQPYINGEPQRKIILSKNPSKSEIVQALTKYRLSHNGKITFKEVKIDEKENVKDGS